MIALDWGAATDVGRHRQINEDAILAMAPLFLVADGMGGHAAGEVASALTVDVFAALATIDTGLTRSDVVTALRTASEAIWRTAAASDGRAGMGTTAVGLAVVSEPGGEAICGFNVGDSRLYRAAGGSFAQLSTDHSYVQELIDRGEIAPADARTHPQRNVITRMLGGAEGVEPDVWVIPAVVGDRYLVCSDGLSGEVDAAAIERTVLHQPDPRIAARTLIEQALANGGRDNISVIVVDVVAIDVAPAGADTAPRAAGPDDAEITKPRDSVAEQAAADLDVPTTVLDEVPWVVSGATTASEGVQPPEMIDEVPT